MELKGLDDAGTCNSKELDWVTPPARNTRAFQNVSFIEAPSTKGDKLHPAQNKRFKIVVHHIFRNESVTAELQMYMWNIFFAIPTNWFIHKVWFRFVWKEMSCIFT